MRIHNPWSYRRLLLSRKFAQSVWNARRNLAAIARGRPLPAGPYLAELDVTYRCNLKCRMCRRWLDSRRDELGLHEYEKLAAEFHALGVHQVSIAGGEPLLRADIFGIIAGFARRGMSVNLCTNGMLVEKYWRQISSSGAACVTVSLDGATPGRHDEIRGVAGSWRQVVRGIGVLLAKRRGRAPMLRVRMTVSGCNAHEIRPFYEHWRNSADDILFQPVHFCRDAFYSGMPEGDMRAEPALLNDQLRETPLARDPYMRGMVSALSPGGGPPPAPCFAGVLMARIDPWGCVYPCLEQHVCVGSVRREAFSRIWHSKPFDEERDRLAFRRSCRCWYNNTALIGHFGALLKCTVFPGRRAFSFGRPGALPTPSE